MNGYSGNISVTPATIEDVPALSILFDNYRQFYQQPSNLAAAKLFLSARLNNNESVVLQAKNGPGEILGFCQLYPSFCSILAAPIYVLYDLFVAAENRGHGIAKKLLEAAHQYASAHGFVRMDLTTAKTNLAAQSLYESSGWTRDNIYYAYNKPVSDCAHLTLKS